MAIDAAFVDRADVNVQEINDDEMNPAAFKIFRKEKLTNPATDLANFAGSPRWRRWDQVVKGECTESVPHLCPPTERQLYPYW
ncbi:hypothetical protein Moror_3406 [Moniliophthora roreri MCA 2997]|uniref:Uncharacterized protein n=1 Tax=Moniliophthora roreri (strain MCA 2997) TaxID=1381753 RepID=V2Y5F0_MONRO|nr:hypothetical protein Moror_3406 [Moniliophthora roreri MCA 2997]